jgi:hypothetical protein
MKSIRTDSFKKYYAGLPAEIQTKAVETYKNLAAKSVLSRITFQVRQ